MPRSQSEEQLHLLRKIAEATELTRKAVCCTTGGTTPPTPLPEYDSFVLCGDTGQPVIQVVTYSVAGAPTFQTYNVNGTPYTGVSILPCPGKNYESDPVEICVSGTQYIQWLVKENGEPTGIVYYTDVDGAITPAPVGVKTIGKCPVVTNCLPTISSATGNDLSTLLAGTSFAFTKPSCCAVTVTTDIGTFTIPAGVNAYATSEFACAITIVGVATSGNCSPASVNIISNFKG